MEQDARGTIHLVYAWKMRRIRHVMMNESWLRRQPAEPLA
jgi:predicted neuraminidase